MLSSPSIAWKIVTRGCHGPLFNPWTVPETAISQADQITDALRQLQKTLKRELKSTAKKNERLEKTSAIGGTSILSGYKAEGSQKQWEIERQRLKAEQERVPEIFSR